MKAEYGLSDKQALKAATDMYSGSGNTIRVNQKIEENLSPEFTEELDSGNIAKGDAAVIADMEDNEQAELFADFKDADDDEKEDVIKKAVKKQTEKTKVEKEKKKAAKKKDKKEDPLPISTSELPPAQKARIRVSSVASSASSRRWICATVSGLFNSFIVSKAALSLSR